MTFESFQKHYVDLVNDDSILLNWQSFTKNCPGETDDAIRGFIVYTQSFQNRVQDIFNRLYPVICDKMTTDKNKLFSLCLDKFRQCSGFSVQLMTDMLRNIVDECEDNEHNKNDEDSVCETDEVVTRNGCFSESSIPHINERFIADFENHVKRPMYAHELLIVSKSQGIDNAADVVMHIRTMYQVVSDVVLRYEGKHISEHEFARDYLKDVFGSSEDDITDRMVRRLMAGRKYIDGMMDRIKGKLKFLTGDTPSDEDVDYCFDCVTSRKLHLLDDSIDDLLSDLISRKVSLIERISEVYQATYCRAPDEQELFDRIQEFRRDEKRGVNPEAFDESLRRELCEDLEYHDVIRRKIEDVLKEMRRNTPRLVFAVMKGVLAEVSPLWDTEKLYSFIDRCAGLEL